MLLRTALTVLFVLAGLTPAHRVQAQKIIDTWSMATGVDTTLWMNIDSVYTTLIAGGNKVSGRSNVTDLGFTFQFGAYSHTQFSTNLNGTVRFGSAQATASGYGDNPLAGDMASGPKIEPFGAEGRFFNSSYTRMARLTDSAGNKIVVIESRLSGRYWCSENDWMCFQVQIFETGGVRLVYGESTNYSACYSGPGSQAGLATTTGAGSDYNNKDVIFIDFGSHEAYRYDGNATRRSPAGVLPEKGRWYMLGPDSAVCPYPPSVTSTGQDPTNIWLQNSYGGLADLHIIIPATGVDTLWPRTESYFNIGGGFNPYTTYTGTVQSVCDSTHASYRTRDFQFTTGCGPVMHLPWAAGFNQSHSCWNTDQYSTTTAKWRQSSNAMLCGIYGSVANTYDEWMYSPVLNLPDVDGILMQWEYQNALQNGTPATVEVMVAPCDSAGTVNAADVATIYTIYSTNTSYTLYQVPMEAWRGQRVKVAFHRTGSGGTYAYIRNFALQQILEPSVVMEAPASVRVDDTTTISCHITSGALAGLTFSWHSTLLDSTFDGVNGENGSNVLTLVYPAEGYDTITVTATNAYGTATATTVIDVRDCRTVTEFPWNEGFEHGFTCWDMPTSGLNVWNLRTTGAHSGQTAAGSTEHDVYNPFDTLVSQPIAIPADAHGLTLAWWMRHDGNTGNVNYRQMLVKALNASNPVWDAADTLFYRNSIDIPTTYERFTVDLEPLAGQTIRLAFAGSSYESGKYIYIDDIEIRYTNIPVVALEAPQSITRGDTAEFTVTLVEGDTAGLTYTWHSSLMDSTFYGVNGLNGLSMVYSTGGTDTLVVTATNAYGSVSDTAIIVVCPIVRTFPWEENFEGYAEAAYNYCWTLNGWQHLTNDNYGGTLAYDEDNVMQEYHQLMRANTVGKYMLSPVIEVPATGVENLSLWVECDPPLMVRLSPTGSTDVADYTDTLFTVTATGSEQTMWWYTAPLAPYAGQSVRVGIFKASGSGYQAHVNSVKVDIDTLPRLNAIAGPTQVGSSVAATFTASLRRGSTDGLVYSWHSSLMDSSFYGVNGSNRLNVVYTMGGTDTLTVVATNAYGSDTISTIVNVIDCTPVTALPWTDGFEGGFECWQQPEGSLWHLRSYYGGTYVATLLNHGNVLCSRISTDSVDNLIVSKPIDIPSDTNNNVVLEWKVSSSDFTFSHNYMVLVSTDTDNQFDTIYREDNLRISSWTKNVVSLTQYAGQTVRVAFANRPTVLSPSSNLLIDLYIDDITIRTANLPVVTLTTDGGTIYSQDTVAYTATLVEGNTNGLTYSWHSTLLDSTFSGVNGFYGANELHLVYPLNGTDTVSVIASNAFGSDTATLVVNVVDHPLPQVTVSAPATVLIPDTAVITATINECSQQGLVVSLRSTLMDTTYDGVNGSNGTYWFNVNYTAEGVDTVTVVAVNVYGADTATAVIEVVNCNAKAVPYLEDFEGVATTAWNAAGNMPTCWLSTTNGTQTQYAPHVIANNGYSYLSNMPDKALLLVAGSSNYGNRAEAVLPRFADALPTLSLALDYRYESAYSGTLSVGYYDDSNLFVTVKTLTPHTGNYLRDTINFGVATLPDAQIVIRWEHSSSYYAAVVDNINVFHDNSIFAPVGLTLDTLGSFCAGLSWMPFEGATGYHVTVDNLFDTVIDTTAIAFCGLTPNTAYTAHVATIVGSDTGNIATLQFSTPCRILGLPWFEDFQGSSPLTCWHSSATGYGGMQICNESYWEPYCHSGSRALQMYNYSTQTVTYVSTPVIEAQPDQLLVSFWASDANEGGMLEAGVMSDPTDTSTFIPLLECNLTGNPARFEFDTRSIPTNSFVALAFRQRIYSHALLIDDISIEALTPCARLRSASSYPVDAHTAVVEWQYDTASAIPNTGAMVTLTDLTDTGAADIAITATGSSYTFGGLVHGHRYQASVQALCSDDTSAALTTIVIPSGNVCAERIGSASSGWFLTNVDRPYSYSQTLYPATLAATIDTLYGIAYRLVSSSIEQYQNGFDTYSTGPRIVDIYIGQTTANTLTTPVNATNLTLAVQNYEFPLTDTGWVRINFTTPVPLDGTSNLIVTFDDNTGAVYGDAAFGHHNEEIGNCLYTNSASYNYSQTYDPYNPSSFTAISAANTIGVPDIQLLGGCSSDRCLQPIVTVTDEDTHSVSLGWQQRGSETLWQVEYMIEGDSVWNIAGTTANTTYTITGLNAATTYRVRVATICTDETIYSDMHRVHTSCGIVSVPYYQTFRADYMPASQSSINENGIHCWQTGNITLLSQERGLWNTHQNGDYIISPEIGADLNGVQVRLSASGSTFFLSGLKVGACAADGTNITWIDTITLADNAQEYTITMLNYTGNERHIAIGGSYETWTLYDVHIENTPTCMPVHHVSLGQLDDTSAGIHWPPVNHSGSWAVYLDDSLVGITTDTVFSFGNLVPASTHTIGVREICSAGDTAMATTLSVTTLCAVEIPWTENFDGGVNQQMPDCWYPIFRPHIGSSNNAYILGAGSNPYLYFYDHYSPYNDIDNDTVANFVCSPMINAAGNILTVSFNARKNSSAGIFQAGFMTNPADTSSFIPMLTLVAYSSTDSLYQFTTDSINLPAKFCLAFRSWGEATCSVDDINIDFMPTPTHVLTLAVNDTAMGSVIGGGTYEEGATVTVMAVANAGYHFVHWSDSVIDAVREIVIQNDITLTAYFEQDSTPIPDTVWRTVNIISANPTMGSVSGSGEYPDSTTITISATANEGYHFIRWNDNNTDDVRQILVTSDTTLTAYFEQDSTPIPDTVWYTVSLSCDSTMGYVTGGGRYAEGTTATLTAEPLLVNTNEFHYEFDNWSDGNTDNPRQIVVNTDISLRANFRRVNDVGIDNCQLPTADYKLYPNPASSKVTIEITESCTLSIMTETGREVMRVDCTAGSTTVDISRLAAGVYFVRPLDTTLPAHKLIVR